VDCLLCVTFSLSQDMSFTQRLINTLGTLAINLARRFILLPRYTNEKIWEIFHIMERLEQGHLQPKLEVPRLTCPGRESNPGGNEHSRKEPFKQLKLIAILNLYMAARPSACGCYT
jgi:hypothetical protein